MTVQNTQCLQEMLDAPVTAEHVKAAEKFLEATGGFTITALKALALAYSDIVNMDPEWQPVVTELNRAAVAVAEVECDLI